jgi:COX assembly protein 2
MHPHVYEHKNPDCADLIRQLQECHARGLWSKLTNECSALKDSLNACLSAEVSRELHKLVKIFSCQHIYPCSLVVTKSLIGKRRGSVESVYKNYGKS